VSEAVLAATSAPLPAPGMPLRAGVVLPVARYRFSLRMQDDLHLPEYSGSLLRGNFGAALRRTACMTGLTDCAGCPLYRTCPYPAVFETPAPETHPLQRFSQVPNPYIVEPPPLGTRHVPAGEVFSLAMVLVGRALDQLPLVAYAMQRALSSGIGRHRARGSLVDVALEGPDRTESVWDPESSSIGTHEQTLFVPSLPDIDAVTLNIVTPLRLQNQGHRVPLDRLHPRTLFAALLRRTSLLFELHAALPGLAGDARRLAAAAAGLADQRRLQWKDWTRFSSRQDQEMTLGGVIGEWKLAGDLGELLPWFWVGQWLHVGKNATMGMGGICSHGNLPTENFFAMVPQQRWLTTTRSSSALLVARTGRS
jgi:CRISPR-associated endoribonuclease Cas6